MRRRAVRAISPCALSLRYALDERNEGAKEGASGFPFFLSCSAKKMVKQVERLQVQLSEEKSRNRELSGQLTEAADYKARNFERSYFLASGRIRTRFAEHARVERDTAHGDLAVNDNCDGRFRKNTVLLVLSGKMFTFHRNSLHIRYIIRYVRIYIRTYRKSL